MRKVIIAACLTFCLFSAYSQSEGLKYGARVGLGSSEIQDAGLGEDNSRLAFSSGIHSVYQILTFFGFQGGVYYVNRGTAAAGAATIDNNGSGGVYAFEDTYTLHTITVPVMPKLSYGFENFYVKFFGGPAVNMNIAGRVTRRYDDDNVNERSGYSGRDIENFSFFGLDAVAGAGFDIEITDRIISIDFRQHIPLSSFGSINGNEAKNSYFTVGLGFLY